MISSDGIGEYRIGRIKYYLKWTYYIKRESSTEKKKHTFFFLLTCNVNQLASVYSEPLGNSSHK